EAAEISDLSLNDNPTRAICTLHRSDPRRPGVLLRRYDTTGDLVGFPFSAFTTTAVTVVFHDMELDADPRGHPSLPP
ncbi:hypothetical protein, partial [Brevibacterium casei]|uniref:hypothetical protein n=1 Tax=Brevibacterium casei TaxID=33889 RepID=UPI0031580AE8